MARLDGNEACPDDRQDRRTGNRMANCPTVEYVKNRDSEIGIGPGYDEDVGNSSVHTFLSPAIVERQLMVHAARIRYPSNQMSDGQ